MVCPGCLGERDHHPSRDPGTQHGEYTDRVRNVSGHRNTPTGGPSPVPTIPKKIEHAAGYTLRLGGKLKDRADAPRSEWVVLGSSRASMRTELGDLSWSLVAC